MLMTCRCAPERGHSYLIALCGARWSDGSVPEL